MGPLGLASEVQVPTPQFGRVCIPSSPAPWLGRRMLMCAVRTHLRGSFCLQSRRQLDSTKGRHREEAQHIFRDPGKTRLPWEEGRGSASLPHAPGCCSWPSIPVPELGDGALEPTERGRGCQVVYFSTGLTASLPMPVNYTR